MRISTASGYASIVAALALCAPVANAADQEAWDCKSYGGNEVIVKAVINADGKTGSIAVAGTVHKAAYYVEGFDRRWDFGETLKSGNARYSFVINPHGGGTYYDFTKANKDGMAKPSDIVSCDKI